MLRSDPPTVVRSVTVSATDLNWHAEGVPRVTKVIQSLPALVTSDSALLHILSTIQRAWLCPGNPKEHFVRLLERKPGGKMWSFQGSECICG